MPNRIPWYVVLVFPAIVIGAWWFTRDPKMELAVQPRPGMTLTETAAQPTRTDFPHYDSLAGRAVQGRRLADQSNHRAERRWRSVQMNRFKERMVHRPASSTPQSRSRSE